MELEKSNLLIDEHQYSNDLVSHLNKISDESRSEIADLFNDYDENKNNILNMFIKYGFELAFLCPKDLFENNVDLQESVFKNKIIDTFHNDFYFDFVKLYLFHAHDDIINSPVNNDFQFDSLEKIYHDIKNEDDGIKRLSHVLKQQDNQVKKGRWFVYDKQFNAYFPRNYTNIDTLKKMFHLQEYESIGQILDYKRRRQADKSDDMISLFVEWHKTEENKLYEAHLLNFAKNKLNVEIEKKLETSECKLDVIKANLLKQLLHFENHILVQLGEKSQEELKAYCQEHLEKSKAIINLLSLDEMEDFLVFLKNERLPFQKEKKSRAKSLLHLNFQNHHIGTELQTYLVEHFMDLTDDVSACENVELRHLTVDLILIANQIDLKEKGIFLFDLTEKILKKGEFLFDCNLFKPNADEHLLNINIQEIDRMEYFYLLQKYKENYGIKNHGLQKISCFHDKMSVMLLDKIHSEKIPNLHNILHYLNEFHELRNSQNDLFKRINKKIKENTNSPNWETYYHFIKETQSPLIVQDLEDNTLNKKKKIKMS